MVGVLGFEPRISWSQAKRVKPFPYTPKNKKASKFFRTRGLKSYDKMGFQLRVVARTPIGAELLTFGFCPDRYRAIEMECLSHRTFPA